jgi:hypothetical protein
VTLNCCNPAPSNYCANPAFDFPALALNLPALHLQAFYLPMFAFLTFTFTPDIVCIALSPMMG